MAETVARSPRRHDVIVIGGGNGGMSLAARLRKRGCPDVALIEPSAHHVYKPLQNYVAGGLARRDELVRAQTSLVPQGVRLYPSAAQRVDAGRREVMLADGTVVVAGDVVIACGAETDWESLPGARRALRDGIACTSFELEHVERTWDRIRALDRGTALFTLHGQPASGRETALKPLFLACDHWRRRGVLSDVRVVLVHDADRLHPVDEIAGAIRTAIDDYGIEVLASTRVESIEQDALAVDGPEGTARIAADLIHLLPPYRAPAFVCESGLAGEQTQGFVDVDPRTLQHRDHPHIWALGDAADLGDARTGGALRHQVKTVVENIPRRRSGRPLLEYDGYTVAPITTSRRALVFGEYDSRTHRVMRTIPLLDPLRPRPWWFALDRWVLPQLYWHGIVRGRV
ncbi:MULTISPECIES: NAD(P)/FAD-dependent oxidoreductase [unclassified Microbacterium]|uniref:NAD(P)/FAD-dependent oxidoreductase n=1 Tax=Microbacterium TaxID=33882 RepID=UPI003B9DF7FC